MPTKDLFEGRRYIKRELRNGILLLVRSIFREKLPHLTVILLHAMGLGLSLALASQAYGQVGPLRECFGAFRPQFIASITSSFILSPASFSPSHPPTHLLCPILLWFFIVCQLSPPLPQTPDHTTPWCKCWANKAESPSVYTSLQVHLTPWTTIF